MLPPGEVTKEPPRIEEARSPTHSKWLLFLLPVIFLGLAAMAAAVIKWQIPIPQCTFKLHTGYPCPFCGSTRTLAKLFTLHIVEAIKLNPLLAVSALASPMLWAKSFRKLPLPPAKFGPHIFLTVLALNWLYLLLYLP